ncbi:hypothetical protein [Plantactinospora soyae]|uniref:Uncharacterized protein n=1 Tax=Plantactinospora soyae TaxID=1544732 RepID=A0A927M2L1_9ACTN|nr:hypothetical protein [Plantactinospora soyae]MBE1485712.1 hypothetical protein [Plantactinospora soyae]
MAKDFTAAMEPVFRPVLAPGERLLIVVSLTRDMGTTEDVSVPDELKNLLDPTILVGGSHPGNLLQRLTFGRALLGGRDSSAGRLYAAIDGVTAPTLVLTDRRLVIADLELVHLTTGNWLRRWLGPTKQVARVVHQVPRESVAGAVLAPAGLLRRGRFLVVFPDASACSVVSPLPEPGRRAAALIGPVRPSDPTAPSGGTA